LILCSAGFLLGALRAFWLEPRLGETVVVLCEPPVLLIASAMVDENVGLEITALAAMGIGALGLQQLSLGALSRGITRAQHIAHFVTAPGMVYLALVFCLISF
jgi:hypothetical protein